MSCTKLTLSLIVIGGIVGSAHATKMYTAAIPFFSDGLDLETGDLFHDPTVIVVLMGPEDQITQVITPPSLADFSLFPQVDLHFQYGPVHAVSPYLVIPEVPMQIGIITSKTFDEVDFGFLAGLLLPDINVGDALAFDPEALLVFKKPSSELFWVMDILAYVKITPLEVMIKSVIPEPSMLLLLGLGLAGLIWIIRRGKNGKRHIKEIMMFLLVVSVVVTTTEISGQEVLYQLISVHP